VEPRSPRAASLASGLGQAAARLAALIESIDGERWRRVPAPGTWSIGKEAEHAVEAIGYHAWIVRRTIGQRVGPRRPPLERKRLTTDLAPTIVSELLRERAAETERLLIGLSDAQLDLATKPPRAATPLLPETIQHVLIEHLDGHRRSIQSKLHR
jgi:hypothetical protein